MKDFMKNLWIFLILAGLLPFAAQAATTNNSGLPIPRFVALKSPETNVRSGPGTRYPIAWVYRRASMPVEVVEEYEYWRKIRDIEGTTGWVHKSMLAGQRTVMIKGKEAQLIRREPKEKSQAILKSEPLVIAQLIECEPEWCRIQISGRKGWIEKTRLWGVYEQEVFD